MKFIKVSTTSKLYFLTLVLVFALILLNQSVFAQSANNDSTPSQKRLKIMDRYLTWINDNEYGEYKTDLGKRTLGEFKSFLSRVTLEDRRCLSEETDPAKQLECKKKVKFDYKLAKKYNRVLKYLQIDEGKPNVCIKADMGVGTALKARGLNPAKVPSPSEKAENPKETGLTEKSTVYLCTGSDGSKKVRVIDDSGTLLRLSEEDAKRPELQEANLPPKASFDILIKKLGLTPASGKISANPNPCTIPSGSQTCGEVEVEWDVTDETSDPVEVRTPDGELVERSRNGSADITNIGPNGQTFILYSLGRKIAEVFVKAVQQ